MNKQLRHPVNFSLALAISMLVTLSSAFADVRFADNFENGKVGSPPNDKTWGACSGNCPLVTNKIARSGKQSLHAYLNRITSKTKYRTESVVRSSTGIPMGSEVWYGISIYVPKGYPDGAGFLMQFANNRERELGEINTGIVPSALSVKDGLWHFFNQSNADQITTKYSDRKRTQWKFPLQKGTWTDWVFHAKWSYKSDGVLQIWQNGKMVADKKGPNCYNDPTIPKAKFGVYKRQWDPKTYIKKYGLESPEIFEMSAYFDDIAVATGSNARYEDVAPGNGKPAPNQVSNKPPVRPSRLRVN